MTDTATVEVKKEPEDYNSDPEDAGATTDPEAASPELLSAADIDIKQEIKQEIKTERSEDYDKLLDYGLDGKVAAKLDEMTLTGKLKHSDLDERALDALKEFPTEGALAVLSQFTESNLQHVSNKSAYLCGVMKTYRQKTRDSGRSGAGSSSGSTSGLLNGVNGGSTGSSTNLISPRGPDQDKINEILKRTGYTLDVTTGQRKYGGPPPGWDGEPPGNGCEIFCGKIPRDLYEDELIPLFEDCGQIWDLRLMMDPMTGLNRGYAFVTFTNRESAQEAVRKLDEHDLGEGKCLKVNVSEPKARLFIGNIPKSKGKSDIEEEFHKLSAGLREVIIYSSPDDKKKNRGFCFLEYESHKAASLAKRRLETGRVKVWSCDIIVDWADPQEEPDAETMSQVKVLYVRNLTVNVTEEKLREVFEKHGKVDRVKKIKDYAFVHFEERDQAKEAMDSLNGQDVCGTNLQISLAKPPSDKKKKEEMLRKREQRMMKSMSHGMALPPFPPFPPAFGPMGAPGLAAAMYRAAHPAAAPGPGGRGGGMSMRGGFQRGYDNGGYYGAWGWSGDASWASGHSHHPAHHHHHAGGGPSHHSNNRNNASSSNGSADQSAGAAGNTWNGNGGRNNNNWNNHVEPQQNGYFNGNNSRNNSHNPRGKLKA